jgi:thiamine-phosphate pyrophosphorylase
MKPEFDLSLYLVAGPADCRNGNLIPTVMAAIEGGVTIVQLRDKTLSDADFIALGKQLFAAMTGTNVPLIINDRVSAALAVGAHGVHVGTSDMPPSEARKLVGDHLLIGTSVDVTGVASLPDPAFADYVGVGPVHATSTKPDHDPPIGFDGLARICTASAVPTAAIGGLSAKDANPVFTARANGMCVVSAICGQDDPHAAAQTLADAIRKARP